MVIGLMTLLVGCSGSHGSVIGRPDAAAPSHPLDGAVPDAMAPSDGGERDSGPSAMNDAGDRDASDLDAADHDSGVRQDASNGEPTCAPPSDEVVGAEVVFKVVNKLDMPIFLAHTPPTYCEPHLWLVPCKGGDRITWQPPIDLCECSRCESSCELCTQDQCGTERCDTEAAALPSGASVDLPWQPREHIEASSACESAAVCATSRPVPAGDYVLSIPVHADAASAARNAAFRTFEILVHLPPEGGSIPVELTP